MTSTDQTSATTEVDLTSGADDRPGEAATEDAVLADNLAETPADSAEPSLQEEVDDAATDDEDAESDDDNPLEVEAEVAADYLEELLDIADLDGDIDTYVDGDRAHVSIVSDSTTLVGKSGEVLDALQELTRLAVLADTGQRSRLMLDVAGYRAQRRDELIALAGDAVQEVKDTSEPVHLGAMNPFERKIVHDAVAAAGLTSESEGEEPRRHVVVLPARG
ncbi:MAG TPA: R3H domain-containing nucleic acid-binding protein [Microlunatus sp.]|nr:R3H domain-containing nucleic acid-binding protein [Microlunatus sp.]